MSQLVIPVLPSVPYQSVKVTLDGVSYGIDLHWNRRALTWYLDLFDANRVAIVHGRPVLVGAMLFRSFHHLAVPPGELCVFDTQSRDLDPGFDDLGTRVQLVYQDRAELEAQGALAEAVRE